jgi:hypothetical protein
MAAETLMNVPPTMAKDHAILLLPAPITQAVMTVDYAQMVTLVMVMVAAKILMSVTISTAIAIVVLPALINPEGMIVVNAVPASLEMERAAVEISMNVRRIMEDAVLIPVWNVLILQALVFVVHAPLVTPKMEKNVLTLMNVKYLTADVILWSTVITH